MAVKKSIKKVNTVKPVAVRTAKIVKNATSRVAVFAGSFDPFTLGHLDIARRAASLFDELWILVAVNASKNCMLGSQSRMALVRKACAEIENLKIAAYDGLTTDFMKQVGACYLVRGVRNARDMDYEQSVAWNNKILYPECESVYLSCAQEHLSVSSTVVRELLKCGIVDTDGGMEKLEKFVPRCIAKNLVEEFRKVSGGR